MKKLLLIISFLLFHFSIFAQPPSAAWINEIHYDNAGTDENEFVEVVVNQ